MDTEKIRILTEKLKIYDNINEETLKLRKEISPLQKEIFENMVDCETAEYTHGDYVFKLVGYKGSKRLNGEELKEELEELEGDDGLTTESVLETLKPVKVEKIKLVVKKVEPPKKNEKSPKILSKKQGKSKK